MPTIPESYASPLLRWALLVEDHPGATHTFDVVVGTELGIPEGFGGKGEFLRCTVRFGKGSGREPAVGWKPLAGVKRTPDDYNVLSTKALGRALKRSGYPDDLADLKACVLWRQRRAEIAAIQAGTTHAIGAGAPETIERALDAASVEDPDTLGHDDTPEGEGYPLVMVGEAGGPWSGNGYDGGGEDEDDEAVLVDPETGEVLAAEEPSPLTAPPSEATRENLRDVIAESARCKTQPALRAYAKDQGWSMTDPPNEAAALALIGKGIELAEGPM